MLWHLLRGGDGAAPRERAGDAAAQAAGFVLPLLVALAVFAALGATWEFVYHNFLINAAWPTPERVPHWWRTLSIRNPELIIGGAAGAAFVLVRCWRGEARLPELFALGAVLSLVAGLLVIPVAQRQYYLLGLPFLAVLAANGWVQGLSWAFRSVRARAAALGVLMVVIAVHSLLQPLPRLLLNNARQLHQLRYVIEETAPESSVLNVWFAPLLFRPAAFRYFFLHEEVCAFLGEQEWGELTEGLESGRIRPELIAPNPAQCPFPPPIAAFVGAHYVPTGVGGILRRLPAAAAGEEGTAAGDHSGALGTEPAE
jgi:hypothetical protein